MKPVHKILTVKHGSHLYGTSTPSSDLDYKSIHLPSGRNILLGRPEDVIELGVKTSEGLKNSAEDVDHQSYSLQKYLMMLSKGDTVATEMLFSPDAEYMDQNIWPDIYQNRMRFLNRDCRGFVGYCVRQAAKYGIKGSRMSAVKNLIDMLSCLAALDGGRVAKLSRYEDALRELVGDHTDFVNIPTPQGVDLWHINCCDRMMPLTSSIGQALDVYTKVWENYGERARAAMTNEGIDWKAMSHAVRVAQQAIELLSTGSITFPRPQASWLLQIKKGELSYSLVSGELEILVEQVQTMDSILPETSDYDFIDEFVLKYYKDQTCA